jgi:hypothetical protein
MQQVLSRKKIPSLSTRRKMKERSTKKATLGQLEVWNLCDFLQERITSLLGKLS